jgi:hypothetical protein
MSRLYCIQKKQNIADILLAFPDKSQGSHLINSSCAVHLKSFHSSYTYFKQTISHEFTLHEETEMSRVGRTGQGLQASRRKSFHRHHPDKIPTQELQSHTLFGNKLMRILSDE